MLMRETHMVWLHKRLPAQLWDFHRFGETMSKKPSHKCITKYCRRKPRKNRKLCERCAKRRWRASHPIQAKLSILRCRAQRKHLPFDLQLDWFSQFLAATGYDPKQHHIDRISSIGGYTKNNLQVLDATDNIAKGNRERHGQAHMF